jgi:hypothetical protein
MPYDNEDISNFLENLRLKHREIDENLSRLSKYKYVDQLQIQTLKRKKLKLKDQISILESNLIPDQLA